MPTSEFGAYMLRTLLNGNMRTTTTARQGWDQTFDGNYVSGGDRNTRRGAGYMAFTVTGLGGKTIKGGKLRLTTGPTYGTSSQTQLTLYHMKHKYSATNGSHLDPDDYYPQRHQDDPASAKIYEGTGIGTMGRSETKTLDIPLAHLQAAMNGYCLCFYGRGTLSTPTYTEHAREIVEAVLIVEWEEPYSAAGAPTAASLSAALSEGNVTGAWSGAGAGNSNAITGYEIQYREKTKTGAYGAWTAYTTVQSGASWGSIALPSPGTRGSSREYRIRTLGAAGAAYYSGYVSMGTVKRNEAPTAPTAFTAGPALFENGPVTLTFSGAADGDGNIAAYRMYRSVNDGGWQHMGDFPGSPLSDSPTVARGGKVRYLVYALDAFGILSGEKVSNYIYRNQAPPAPAFVYPVSMKTTYNGRPYMQLTIPREPDGQAMTLYYSVDGGPSVAAGTVAPGSQVVRLNQVSPGQHTIKCWLQDALGAASGSVQRTINVAAAAFGRTIGANTLLNDTGGGHSGSGDIGELLAMINALRGYYGLGAATITRSTKHFHTWMQNMDDLWQLMRETTNLSGAQMPAKVTKARNAPSAGVINQLRGVLPTL